MIKLVESIGKQIEEAISIGKSATIKPSGREITQVLVCGLGGSGIGGKIISQLFQDELKVPFILTNDYSIPACVNSNTLVIASSYSGNTEETIAAVEEAKLRNAEVVAICSGGKLQGLAIENNWGYVLVPPGEQPRAMLVYSLVQQIFILSSYNLISPEHVESLLGITKFLAAEETSIKSEAIRLANFFDKHIPVIYSGSGFEAISIRFRQQLNENSKVLCWNHILPEMTHNELVGWAGGTDEYAVVYLRTDFDHQRTNYRWEIIKPIIQAKTKSITEIVAKGSTRLHQNFYLIHLTDFVSVYLADLRKVDPVEVNVIGTLKAEMGKRP